MNRVKRFIQTSFVYLVGNVLSKLVAFFLIPLYTSKISPEQYGIYDLVIAFVNLFAPLAFFQIWDGMFRVTFDYEKEEDKYRVISNSVFVSFVGAFLYALIFGVVYSIIPFEHAMYVFAYGCVFSLHYLYGYICRVFLDNKLSVISGFISTLITALLNVVLILYFNWDIKSLYFAPTVGMLVQILIVEFQYKVLRHFKWSSLSKNTISQMLRFSLPLCLSGVSYWLLSGFTKLVITYYLGAADNGLFAIANRFASLVILVITIFQYAWNEMSYMMANDKSRTNVYNICIDLLIKFVLLGSAGLCVGIKIIFPYFVAEQYSQAIAIIPATIIGSMLNAMSGFISTMFMTEKKTNVIMYSTLVSAAVNIILGIVLTKIWGLQGASIALGIAFGVLLFIRMIQAQKYFKIAVKIKIMLIFIGILIVSVIEFYLVNNIWCDIFYIFLLLIVSALTFKDYIIIIMSKTKGAF